MWPQVLTDPLRGKTSLWRVIWIYGFGATLVYSLLGWILAPETSLGVAIYFLLGLALGILQSVMLWQCAFNTRSRVFGRLLRAAVVIGLLMVPVMLYVVFKYPEALLPPN